MNSDSDRERTDPAAEATDVVPGMDSTRHATAPNRRKRKIRRILIIATLLLLVPPIGIAGGIYALSEKYLGDIDREPTVFSGIPENARPAAPATEAGGESTTFLVAGVDTRRSTTAEHASTGDHGRTDALMLVRIEPNRDRAYVVSIPRDSWVTIPGHGHPKHAKINAAYAYGGPTLAVRTVENLTDVRIDHFAVIDFAGFAELTDAVGGVTVTIPRDSYDGYRNQHWRTGSVHLSGKQALAYVGQRKGLPRGDISRTHRQQQFLKELFGKISDEASVTSPLALTDLVDTVTKTISVDDELSNGDIRGMLFALRDLRSDDVTYITAPVSGLGTETGGQSVVYLDTNEAAGLWRAFESGELAAYLDDHGGDTLTDSGVN